MTVAVAALLAMYSVYVQRGAATLSDAAAPPRPGYYLNDATITETDATGAARLRLRAAQITQDPRTNDIQLQQVLLNFQSAPDSRWLLTAQQGQVPAQSRILQFSGMVQIQPEPQSAKRDNDMVLRTDKLNVDIDQNIASAPGRVNLQMNQQYLTAIGLHYDLKQQKLKLESLLHGQFKPQ